MATARACLGQHLQLARSLRDRSAEGLACQQLGLLANSQGDYEQALRFFGEARRIALALGEKGLLQQANCQLGIVEGNLKMRQQMETLASRLAGLPQPSRSPS